MYLEKVKVHYLKLNVTSFIINKIPILENINKKTYLGELGN